MSKKIRVLIAKPGLDGHDRGAKIVAHGLMDAGMEVIYTERYQTSEQVVSTAIQEDVDVVGLSSLVGAHLTLFPEIAEMLKKEGKGDILVIGGGIMTKADADILKHQGIAELFRAGTPLDDIVKFIEENVRHAEGG